MKTLTTTALLLLLASTAAAATWHVAKDGTGDFEVIQDAIDAANDGDTIWIHAGRYEEMTAGHDIWHDGQVIVDVHVAVTKDNLTLRGDGANATIIGPAVFPSDPIYNYCGLVVASVDANHLTIQDLAIENVNWGVYGASPELEVAGCRLEGNEINGLRLFADTRATVTDCRFVDCQDSIVAVPPSSLVSIHGCEFVDCIRGVIVLGPTEVMVGSCHFNGLFSNVNFQQGAVGLVLDCEFLNYINYAVYLSLGGYAEIHNCIIDGGLRGIYSSDFATGQGFSCTETILRNQADYAFYLNGGDVSVHGCEIINGGNWSVYCRSASDCITDMTNNYWGTDSEAQIAEWIYDQNDDPELCCAVDFVPFNGSVKAEAHSWSAVKGLFAQPESE